MRPNELQHLYDYNYWANARILDTASHAGPESLASPAGLAHGSMLDTLVHVLQGEWVWRAMKGGRRRHLQPSDSSGT
jgi:uncharacterized damage-inducible protein DinB